MLEIVRDGNDVVLKSVSNVSELVIPSEVTVIGRRCLKENCFFESLEIPGTVLRIEDEAFIYNTYIKKLIIHEGVKYIGKSAFKNNINLEYLEIPSTVEQIGERAFFQTNIESINVSVDNPIYSDECNGIIDKRTSKLLFGSNHTIIDTNKIKTIDTEAFLDYEVRIVNDEVIADAYISASSNLIILEGVTKISGWLDLYDEPYDISSIHINSIYIPKTVTTILSDFLGLCSNVDSIYVDEANPIYAHGLDHKSIYEKEEGKLIKLINGGTIPECIHVIAASAFENVSIDVLELSESIHILEDYAFRLGNIDTIIIPNHIEYFGRRIFELDTLKNLIISNRNFQFNNAIDDRVNVFSSKECFDKYEELRKMGYRIVDMNFSINSRYLNTLNYYINRPLLCVDYDIDTYFNITICIIVGYLIRPQYYNENHILKLLANTDKESVLNSIYKILGLEMKIKLMEIYQKIDNELVSL